MPTDLEHEGFRQAEPGREPGPKQGADEPESYGHDEPSPSAPGDRLADRAADGRDNDEEYESRQCDCHDESFRVRVNAPASEPANPFGSPALSLIHISEPTRLGMISSAVFCLKKKKPH